MKDKNFNIDKMMEVIVNNDIPLSEVTSAFTAAQNKKSLAARREKIADTRGKLINALNDYMYSVHGERMTVGQCKDFSASLQRIEKIAEDAQSTAEAMEEEEYTAEDYAKAINFLTNLFSDLGKDEDA